MSFFFFLQEACSWVLLFYPICQPLPLTGDGHVKLTTHQDSWVSMTIWLLVPIRPVSFVTLFLLSFHFLCVLGSSGTALCYLTGYFRAFRRHLQSIAVHFKSCYPTSHVGAPNATLAPPTPVLQCHMFPHMLPKHWYSSCFKQPVIFWASLVAQRLKRLPAMRETWVRSLGQEDPLEKEMATHSSYLLARFK